jgi:dienelactone hydrolase
MRAGLAFLALPLAALSLCAAGIATLPSSTLTPHGFLYKPSGPGPFPAVLYNYGSKPGPLSKQAFDALCPVFAAHGWVFLGHGRRGQDLTAATTVSLLSTDPLAGQLSALAWLRKQPFIQPNRIAVARNSFGGVEAILGNERANYCAAIASAPASGIWTHAPDLQSSLLRAVQNAHAPIFFFQAANDFRLVVNTAALDVKGIKNFPRSGCACCLAHGFAFPFGCWGSCVLHEPLPRGERRGSKAEGLRICAEKFLGDRQQNNSRKSQGTETRQGAHFSARGCQTLSKTARER